MDPFVLPRMDVARAEYVTIGESVSSTCYLNNRDSTKKRSARTMTGGVLYTHKGLDLRSVGSRHSTKRSVPWAVNNTLLIAYNAPLEENTKYAIFLRTFTVLDDGSVSAFVNSW